MLTTLLINFFLPPLGSFLAKKRSKDKFEHYFYERAYTDSVWGFWLGVGMWFISALLITILGWVNLFSFGSSFSLPLMIGIPWLFSVIGRGLGFHSSAEQFELRTPFLNPAKKTFPIITLALTGDTFNYSFYAYFYRVWRPSKPISNVELQFLTTLSEIGLLSSDGMRRNFDISENINLTGHAVDLLNSLHRLNYINATPNGEKNFRRIFTQKAGPYLEYLAPLITTMERLQLATTPNIDKVAPWTPSSPNYTFNYAVTSLEGFNTVLLKASTENLLDDDPQTRFDLIIKKMSAPCPFDATEQTLESLRWIQHNQLFESEVTQLYKLNRTYFSTASKALQTLREEKLTSPPGRKLILNHPKYAQEIVESFKLLRSSPEVAPYFLPTMYFEHAKTQIEAHIKLLNKTIHDKDRHMLLTRYPQNALGIAQSLIELEEHKATSSENAEFNALLKDSSQKPSFPTLIAGFANLSHAKIFDMPLYTLLAKNADIADEVSYLLVQLNTHDLLTDPNIEFLGNRSISLILNKEFELLTNAGLANSENIQFIWDAYRKNTRGTFIAFLLKRLDSAQLLTRYRTEINEENLQYCREIAMGMMDLAQPPPQPPLDEKELQQLLQKPEQAIQIARLIIPLRKTACYYANEHIIFSAHEKYKLTETAIKCIESLDSYGLLGLEEHIVSDNVRCVLKNPALMANCSLTLNLLKETELLYKNATDAHIKLSPQGHFNKIWVLESRGQRIYESLRIFDTFITRSLLTTEILKFAYEACNEPYHEELVKLLDLLKDRYPRYEFKDSLTMLFRHASLAEKCLQSLNLLPLPDRTWPKLKARLESVISQHTHPISLGAQMAAFLDGSGLKHKNPSINKFFKQVGRGSTQLIRDFLDEKKTTQPVKPY